MAKKVITITVIMSEVLYDIQNKTYLTGRSRKNGQNHEEVANMQANEDDENLNQVIRSVSNAYSSLMAKLSEYMTSSVTESDNELIDGETDLTITLQMPSNFNEAATDAISKNIHQYIVNSSIADWFIITNKPDAAEYVSMATANITDIIEAINRRVRPERKPVP